MATITFTPATEPEDSKPKQESQTVVIREETTIVTAAPAISSNNGIEGEITNSDVRPPRLNLAQKTGALGDRFNPGSFVYEKAFLLKGPSESFNATVLRLKKYYQQKLPFDGGDQRPLKFDTAAEVREAGGQTTVFEAPDFYGEAADILLAVEAPEGIDEENMAYFPYQFEGKDYGICVYTVTSSGFTSIGKRFITDSQILLKDGLFTGYYRISSEKRVKASNSWFVPTASFGGKHSAEASAFFKGMAGL
jgi:hypothetical protein